MFSMPEAKPLAFFTHLMTRHRKPLFFSDGRGIP
jgi:hypothetical protein